MVQLNGNLPTSRDLETYQCLFSKEQILSRAPYKGKARDPNFQKLEYLDLALCRFSNRKITETSYSMRHAKVRFNNNDTIHIVPENKLPEAEIREFKAKIYENKYLFWGILQRTTSPQHDYYPRGECPKQFHIDEVQPEFLTVPSKFFELNEI